MNIVRKLTLNLEAESLDFDTIAALQLSIEKVSGRESGKSKKKGHIRDRHVLCGMTWLSLY